MLNILDEFSRECLAIRIKRKLNSTDVIDALTDLFILRGVPAFIRSDNGSEFVAEAVRKWISAVGASDIICSFPIPSAFAIPFAEPKGKKPAVWHWFASDKERSVFAFAGT